MKKVICVFLLLSFFCILLSCDDVYKEINITDIKQYKEIWNYPERSAGETCLLFPQSVDEAQCCEFLFKHTTRLPLGTDWQVLLEIEYDTDSFLAEKNRLYSLCKDSPICGNSEHFDGIAYATVLNWNGCFEYAIVDENQKKVTYVYLQYVPKEDIILDEKYILNDYDWEIPGCEIYSVYKK